MQYYSRTTQRGFTVLYAVLISSLLLSIGLGIYSISVRDLILSSSASESQKAIFAADSGVECALYWDNYNVGNNRVFFATSTSSNLYDDEAYCGETEINNVGNEATYDNGAWTITDQTASAATTTFRIRFGDAINDLCAFVTVSKNTTTTIDSRGYNTCITENPRRVERAIRVQY